MSDYKNKNITIIRQRGAPNKGQLPDGRWVHKLDKIYDDNWGGLISCADYDDHFIYEAPTDLVGSRWRCSCGSFAIIVDPSGYLLHASPQGKLVVCWHHATYGVHATGGSRWK